MDLTTLPPDTPQFDVIILLPSPPEALTLQDTPNPLLTSNKHKKRHWAIYTRFIILLVFLLNIFLRNIYILLRKLKKEKFNPESL